MGKRHTGCFSSSTRNECSHCEQHRHQVTACPFVSYRAAIGWGRRACRPRLNASRSAHFGSLWCIFALWHKTSDIWSEEAIFEFLLQDVSPENISWDSSSITLWVWRLAFGSEQLKVGSDFFHTEPGYFEIITAASSSLLTIKRLNSRKPGVSS